MAAKAKTINIKGKEYALVNERIRIFRSEHPNWTLATDWEHSWIKDDCCTFIAVIKDENGRVLATGSAREERDASPINKTSYVENCETSSWGRALANLGYCIDGSIASAEEVANAIEQQEIEEAKHKPITQVELDALRVSLNMKNVSEAAICKAYKVSKLEQLTNEQFDSAMRRLEKTERKQ